MGHLFENFRVKERTHLADGMAEAAVALKAAWQTIHAVKLNPSRANFYYCTWFGAADTDRIKLVYESLSTMHYAVSASSIKFRRQPGANDRAAADEPQRGWENKSVKEILESGKFVINLYDPYFEETSEDRGGEFGPAKTFIHELSHVVAETNEPIGTWPEVYGKLRCRTLAIDRPEQAVRNADSYGYFCIAHLEFIASKKSRPKLQAA